MRRPLLSTLAAATLLLLAAAASAQDRGRSDHGDRPSRSRAQRGDLRRSSDHRDSSRRDDGWSGDRSDRNDRPDRGDRRNPFDHGDNQRDDRRPHERTVLGAPYRDYRRMPEHYDGRGVVREPVRFGTPPVHSVLNVRIRDSAGSRGTDVAFGAQIGGLRVGYVSYGDRGYRRGGTAWSVGFGYPYYAYDPFAPDVVVVASPWYRYSYLPPYIDNSRVIVVDQYPSRWDWDGWRDYDYRSAQDNRAIQNSLDDLRDAFEENSTRIAERLLPEGGDVAIYNDGKYDYSLNPDDFEKMFLDGVEQSKTRRYEILDVRTRGDEVRIRARHEYTDSWDKDQSVIHMITLRRDHGGDYVIREFGTE